MVNFAKADNIIGLESFFHLKQIDKYDILSIHIRILSLNNKLVHKYKGKKVCKIDRLAPLYFSRLNQYLWTNVMERKKCSFLGKKLLSLPKQL